VWGVIRRTARFETRRDGYERWRVWEDGRDRYVYVHRLAAVAWGLLDGLGSSLGNLLGGASLGIILVAAAALLLLGRES